MLYTYTDIPKNLFQKGLTSKNSLNKGYSRLDLSNHLGNVMVTVSDKRLGVDDGTGKVDYYLADVTSATDYYPFGSAMPGRSLTGSNKYRFGYQGLEKDFDVNQGAYTTHFRILDTRLGRWFSTDPVFQPYQSPYTSMDNNPIKFDDKLGDEVINGDKLLADNQGQKAEFSKNKLSTFMNDKGITGDSRKKDFLKNGGSKDDWKSYKDLKYSASYNQNLFTKYKSQANKTQKIITKWEKSSPLLFADVDKQKVDFVVFSASAEHILTNYGAGGVTSPVYVGVIGDAYWIVNKGIYRKNAMKVLIPDNVNLTSVDNATTQYNLNHEAGHFLYMVKYMDVYLQMVKSNKVNRIPSNGGHSKNDESGKVADKFGKSQDTKDAYKNIKKYGN